jgi:dienelactone hydrolase
MEKLMNRYIYDEWISLLGEFPVEKSDLKPLMKKIPDINGIPGYHVSFQSEPDDRIHAYLLAPGDTASPKPAVICIHGTTEGSGKDRSVGLSGSRPGDPPDPPDKSRAFGLELAQRGYITLSIDLLCDGERIPPSLCPYDSTVFYKKHPQWSMMGKNAWDVMRSVDFLTSLDFVDQRRIGCVGHSHGGHTTLFATAFDSRISAAVCNGGVLSWMLHTGQLARSPDYGIAYPPLVANYVYLPRLRPYILDRIKSVPVDFDSLMIMTAPRPLLIMGAESEMKMHSIPEKYNKALKTYEALGAGERIAVFSYPGEHGYPPDAKNRSYLWLDRWLL